MVLLVRVVLFGKLSCEDVCLKITHIDAVPQNFDQRCMMGVKKTQNLIACASIMLLDTDNEMTEEKEKPLK